MTIGFQIKLKEGVDKKLYDPYWAIFDNYMTVNARGYVKDGMNGGVNNFSSPVWDNQPKYLRTSPTKYKEVLLDMRWHYLQGVYNGLTP